MMLSTHQSRIIPVEIIKGSVVAETGIVFIEKAAT
jgi:hypothetical protein